MFVYTTMRETISTKDPPGSSRRERGPYTLGLAKDKHWQQCDVATPNALPLLGLACLTHGNFQLWN